MYRTIRAEEIVRTADSLVERVRARFPESGLLRVAEEILAVARETDERCQAIRRPNLPLRIGVALVIAAGLAALAAIVTVNVRLNEAVWDISNFAEASEALLGDVVFLGIAIAFLVGLETRMKRRRALGAMNELRALAHIIDMHQLTKDPEMVLGQHSPTAASPPRNMSAFELNRYLDYCSEMLALVSKVGALYVQTFPDPQALAGVDEIESLTTELSQKVWQKIMILDRYASRAGSLALAMLLVAQTASAHPRHARTQAAPAAAPAGAVTPGAKGVTGQGALRFRVLLTSAGLPEEARKVLTSAHGGFAVDHRPGKGETYFALPGAGILRLSADMRQVALVATPPEVRDTNLHNTKLWFAPDGAAFLSFPANDKGRVFTTSLAGELLHTLARPTADDEFGLPFVRDYFAGGGAFVPTDVEFLDGLLYVTTGYSSLDAVLTARVSSYSPLRAGWFDLGFGGRGSGPGQLGTGHGITVPTGTRRIDVADRANSEIDRYTRHGQYLATLKMPNGSLPCDVDYVGRYAVVGALDGPDRSKGAPIYLFEDDRLVSTLFPKDDLGLENFKHVHNAVLRQAGGKLYVIAQAWNPGDFAVLEQVVP